MAFSINNSYISNVPIPVPESSLFKGWNPNSVPPPGLGAIYLITNLKKNATAGMYVGLTTRSPAIRWGEHIQSGKSSVKIIPGPRPDPRPSEETNSQRRKQYNSSTSTHPLYAAMAIDYGRWIRQNFYMRFIFSIIGYYSLYSLEKREADSISDNLGEKFTPGNSFSSLVDQQYYNLKPGLNRYGADSFIRASNIEKILALQHFIIYELPLSSGADLDPALEAIKGMTLTPALMVRTIAKVLVNTGAYKDINKAVTATEEYLRLKAGIGDEFYLVFNNGKPLATRADVKAISGGLLSLKGKNKQPGAKQIFLSIPGFQLKPVETEERKTEIKGTEKELMTILEKDIHDTAYNRVDWIVDDRIASLKNDIKALKAKTVMTDIDWNKILTKKFQIKLYYSFKVENLKKK